jgi:hypothetical protein
MQMSTLQTVNPSPEELADILTENPIKLQIQSFVVH